MAPNAPISVLSMGKKERPSGITKQILTAALEYQKARLKFADMCAEFSGRGSEALDALLECKAMDTLCQPPLNDPVPAILASTLRAVSNMTTYSGSKAIVQKAMSNLDSIIRALSHPTAATRQAAADNLASIAATSERNARTIIDHGLLGVMPDRLDPNEEIQVKESCLKLLEILVRSGREMATKVLLGCSPDDLADSRPQNTGLLPELTSYLNRPIKSTIIVGVISRLFQSASTVSLDLANAIGKVGAISKLSQLILSSKFTCSIPDLTKAGVLSTSELNRLGNPSEQMLSRSVNKMFATILETLAVLVKKSDDLAQKVASRELVKEILGALHRCELSLPISGVHKQIDVIVFLNTRSKSQIVRYAAANLVYNTSCRLKPLATTVVELGGLIDMTTYALTEKDNMKGLKPAILTFGVISSFTTSMAESVVDAKGHLWCLRCLEMTDAYRSSEATEETAYCHDLITCGTWAVSQIVINCASAAKSLATEGVLPLLLSAYKRAQTHDEKHNCRQAIQAVVRRCQVVGPLESLVSSIAPHEILVDVTEELAKLLPEDPYAKRSFVASGALLRLIGLKLEDSMASKARSNTAKSSLEKKLPSQSQICDQDENSAQWIPRIVKHRQLILATFPEDIVSFHMVD